MVGHVEFLPADWHPVRFVAAGAEDCPADRQDARQGIAVQPHHAVFHQAPEPILEPDHLHVIRPDRRFSHRADRRVQAGAVAARRQNPDCFAHWFDLSGKLKPVIRYLDHSTFNGRKFWLPPDPPTPIRHRSPQNQKLA